MRFPRPSMLGPALAIVAAVAGGCSEGDAPKPSLAVAATLAPSIGPSPLPS